MMSHQVFSLKPKTLSTTESFQRITGSKGGTFLPLIIAMDIILGKDHLVGLKWQIIQVGPKIK